jgi:hypothetical protein
MPAPVRVADGWELFQHFYLDTQGKPWHHITVITRRFRDGDVDWREPEHHDDTLPLDFNDWVERFSEGGSSRLTCMGGQVAMQEAEDGSSYIQMTHPDRNPLGRSEGPLRDRILRLAAVKMR